MKIAVTSAAVLISLVCLIVLGRFGMEAYAGYEARAQEDAYQTAFDTCMEGPIMKNEDAEAARFRTCMEYELGK